MKILPTTESGNSMSTYKALSQLISVNDICESFIADFDTSQSVNIVWEEWCEICSDNALDPMDQIALVKQNHKVIGWVGFDMLEATKTLAECFEPISGDILISSDTPLLEAIQTVCSRNNSIYLVLQGNLFVGFLAYSHFHKLPFRICIFALLIELERLMLEITKSTPSLYLQNLSEGRLTKAKEIYGHRDFKLNQEGQEYDSKLIDCTTFIDKFKMLRKDPVIIRKCPHIKSKVVNKAEELRNSIAHPEGDQSGLLPIRKEDLLPFIQWAEELQIQLYNYTQL